jgi:hypothetical protein
MGFPLSSRASNASGETRAISNSPVEAAHACRGRFAPAHRGDRCHRTLY